MNTKLRLLLATASILPFLTAADNTAPWKIDADGHLVLKDGNPIYVDGDGKELTIAPDTITRLNAEAKAHRTAKDDAEKKLKAFEGLDPVASRAALDAVKNIDTKKLIDAGKVDEVKAEITKQFQTQLAEKDGAIAERDGKINNMLISSVFNDSTFVRDNLAVPKDMFEATFKGNFKVEDGKIVAYGKDNNRIYSKERAGEYADPEEALKILTEGHPQKDVIMKANSGNGTGNEGGGGGRGAGRVMKRGEFEKQTPSKQAEVSAAVRAGTMQLVD